MRTLREATGVSLNGLSIASAATPRRRPGQERIRLHRSTIDGMTSLKRPARPERHNFEVFVDTCLRLCAERGVEAPGDRDSWDAAYRELRDETDDRRPPRPTPVTPDPPRSPYQGLAAFGADDAGYFFGRDRLTAALLDRISGTGGLLIVMGPSGSGKSSLLRAGLVPALIRSGVPEPVVVTPGAVLGEPVARLRRRWAGRPVIIDQFEEVFTEGVDRDAFVEVVTALGAEGPMVVVLGVRADFLGHCAHHPGLVPALERPVVVTPMSRDELLAAIEGPAKVAGLTVEDGLSGQLLEELRGDGDHAGTVGVLPLLSHVLRETWIHRDGDVLTLAAYRATGGVVGALAQTADTVVNELDPAARVTARRLLTRLVHLGSDTADTARRMPLTDLPAEPPVQRVLDRLAQARLVTVDAKSVHLTHEALIRGWPRLRVWIEEDRAELVVLQRLDTDAASWDAGGRDPGYLYQGARLSSARAVHEATAGSHPAAHALAAAFLAASAAAEVQGKRSRVRRRRLSRAAVAVVTVLAVVASVAGVLATRSATRAEAQRREALSRLLSARADVTRPSDPVLAGLLDVAASSYQPTDETRAGLLASLTTPLRTVLHHPSEVTAVAAYGGMVATGGTNGDVQMWDDDGRRLWGPLTDHASSVHPLRFSPDGRILASGDDVMLVREAATGKLLAPPLTGHRGEVTSIVFSADGATMTTADAHSIVQRWETATWRRLGPVLGPFRDGPEGWSVLSADGSTVAVRHDRFARKSSWQVWNLDTGRPKGPPFEAGELALSPDGRTAVTANHNLGDASGLIQRWDLAEGEPTGDPLRIGQSVYAITYHPDGRTVALGTADGGVRLVEAATLRPAGGLPPRHGTGVEDLAYSPDGTRLVTTARESNALIWEPEMWTRIPGPAPEPGPGRVIAAAVISPEAQVTTVEIRVGDLDDRTGGTIRRLDPPGEMALPPGASRVFAPPLGAALDTSGRFLVVALVLARSGPDALPTGARLAVLDRADGRQIAVLDDSPEVARGAASGGIGWIGAMATGAGVVATARVQQRDITLRDLHDLRTISTSPPQPVAPEALAATPDGKAILIAENLESGQGGLVRMVAVEGWAQIGEVFLSPVPVTAMAVSADGAVLTTAGDDGSLRLWDVPSRRQIAVTPAVEAAEAPAYVTFGAGGTSVLAITDEGATVRWPIARPADPVARMCAVAGRSLTEKEWEEVLPADEPYRDTCP